ncbi:MAG: nitroreductase family protein, partial [Saprospiraceae bacterium]|nr:nitroreductase family protein [Saprospiraceae bacterium]
MELGEAILGRRSVRRYTDEAVPHRVLEKIMEAGRWAPTACNVQGFRFIVIDDPQIFERIIQGGAAGFLKKVRQAILVLYDNQTDNVEYQDYVQSAAAGV